MIAVWLSFPGAPPSLNPPGFAVAWRVSLAAAPVVGDVIENAHQAPARLRVAERRWIGPDVLVLECEALS